MLENVTSFKNTINKLTVPNGTKMMQVLENIKTLKAG